VGVETQWVPGYGLAGYGRPLHTDSSPSAGTGTIQSMGNVNSSMPAFAPHVPLPKDAPIVPSPSVPPYHS
jgi:hypothetical protein